MKAIAILPARGGSVRIPRKNIRDFKGKPMIQWPIEAAQSSDLFDRIIVSTDCLEIASIARRLGCLVHERPADDGSKGTQEVAADVIAHMGRDAEFACVIYPCSPLLTDGMLVAGYLWLCHTSEYVMSVQAAPLADAGCFYWGPVGHFTQGLPLICPSTSMLPLPAERCIDINTPDDWEAAEAMFEALK